MARTKKISESIPKYSVIESVKFGWCNGWDHEMNHKQCKIEFHSSSTNKLYMCACKCHEEKNV